MEGGGANLVVCFHSWVLAVIRELWWMVLLTGSYHLHHVFSTVAMRHLDQLP